MPINLLETDDLFEHRALIDLAVHDDILAAVTGYFGQVPRLHRLMMWWSPPNQDVKGSRLYHYDHRDSRQAKVFINLTDVTEENGPLHFLKPADSRKVDAKVGYSQGRYSDEEFYSAVSKGGVLTGGRGGRQGLYRRYRALSALRQPGQPLGPVHPAAELRPGQQRRSREGLRRARPGAKALGARVLRFGSGARRGARLAALERTPPG